MLPEIHPLLIASSVYEQEVFTPLVAGGVFRVEQIVSHGTASPAGFWYDQDDDEWVVLLRGSATIEFEEGLLPLVAGDSLEIPAHLRHRVTAASMDAVWLAVHYRAHCRAAE